MQKAAAEQLRLNAWSTCGLVEVVSKERKKKEKEKGNDLRSRIQCEVQI